VHPPPVNEPPAAGPASGEPRTWLSPSSRAPSMFAPAGDDTTADQALGRTRNGEGLVYQGDYHNARQLLAAMARRLREHPPRKGRMGAGRNQRSAHAQPVEALTRAFQEERRQVRLEHEVLSRLAVPVGSLLGGVVGGGWTLPLRRAPDVAEACTEALGAAPEGGGLLPLRDLLGIIGAHEWRRRGVNVPALDGQVIPHFGVYAPVRGEYVDLAAQAAEAWPVRGKRALDVGTGTGVLALVLAQRGATVLATDLEPRAVACARENAERLGLAAAVEVRRADLFPEPEAAGAALAYDLVVSNPPWVPAEAHTPLDRAVYDPGGRFLSRLLAGLPGALAPGGEAWLILSDLAERLGLRADGEVERRAAAAGVVVAAVLTARPTHPRARAGQGADPLGAARSAEVTRLFRLVKA